MSCCEAVADPRTLPSQPPGPAGRPGWEGGGSPTPSRSHRGAIPRTANRPGSQTMPECRFNMSNAQPVIRVLNDSNSVMRANGRSRGGLLGCTARVDFVGKAHHRCQQRGLTVAGEMGVRHDPSAEAARSPGQGRSRGRSPCGDVCCLMRGQQAQSSSSFSTGSPRLFEENRGTWG
jgi:hypothetical protein